MKKAVVVTLAILFLAAGLAFAGDKAPARAVDQTGSLSSVDKTEAAAFETAEAQDQDTGNSQCTQLSQTETVGLVDCNSNCQTCCYGDCLSVCGAANCCCVGCLTQGQKPEDLR